MAWATILRELEPRHNREEELSRVVADSAQQLEQRLSALRRAQQLSATALQFLKLTYHDLSPTFDAGERQTSALTERLFAATQAAVRGGRAGLALLFDEAQVIKDDTRRGGEFPLSMLIAAVTSLQKEQVPLALVLCGLPTLTGNLLKARTYSERMFRGEHIGSLEHREATEALVQPLTGSLVTADPTLVDEVIGEVEGYPYFIQLWGAELWDAADYEDVQHFSTALLDRVRPEIYRRLDTDFYEPRVKTLTPAEEDLLLTSARCPYPPLLVSELRERSEKSEGNVNVLVGRLTEQGVIYRQRKGAYAFTAPKFYEFLRRRHGQD